MFKHDRLKQLLSYNPKTGVFVWKVPRGRQKADAIAGGTCRGRWHNYRQIRIDGKLYMAHRLAWFWFYGQWPNGMIDHVNRE